jgi:oligosaccharide repeat unit polymerase
MAAAVLALGSSRYSLMDILTLQGLADSANSLAVARYDGQDGNRVVFVLLALGYVAALAAPFIKLSDAKRTTWWAVLPTLTSLAYAAVTSARLGFLLAAALTAGGLIACAAIRNGVAPRTKFKTVVGVSLVAGVLGAAFVGIGVLRTGAIDAYAVSVTVDKQTSYTVGTVGAFSYWLDQYGNGLDQELGFGTATVAGMEYLTGQDRSLTRAYGEFAVIDSTGRTSNVYTAFRGLILDFGIDGTVIVLLVLGFVFGRLYLKTVGGSVVAAALLGYGYATILFSAWMATSTFTNVLIVVLAAPTVLVMAKRPPKQRRKPRKRVFQISHVERP